MKSIVSTFQSRAWRNNLLIYCLEVQHGWLEGCSHLGVETAWEQPCSRVTKCKEVKAVWTSLHVNAAFTQQRERFPQGAQGKHDSREKTHVHEALTVQRKDRPRDVVEKDIIGNARNIAYVRCKGSYYPAALCPGRASIPPSKVYRMNPHFWRQRGHPLVFFLASPLCTVDVPRSASYFFP